MDTYSIIGIDFGTSATVMTVKNYYPGMNRNEFQSIVVQKGTSIPTQVFEREDGSCFFGKDVDSEIQAGSKGCVHRNFKMDLISPSSDVRETAQRVTRLFFKFLYEQFNLQREFLHVNPVIKTYLSYPAKWTPDVIGFMKQCAIDAGFGDKDSVFGETEPTAAIFASLVHNENAIKQGIIAQNVPLNVLMLDMGAGTTDVTVFKLLADGEGHLSIGQNGQIISHPSIDNPYLCGGREIDGFLAAYNEDFLKKALNVPTTPEGLIKLNREGVKEWKEVTVSRRLANESPVPIPGFLSTTLNTLSQLGTTSGQPYPIIDRGVFESVTKDHWSQLRSLLLDAVAKASKVIEDLHGPDDIDIIVVTGGHSQWYCVRNLLLGESVAGLDPIRFKRIIHDPNRLLSESRPQETVACGLAFQDLDFEIRHTASNNLWIQFALVDTNGVRFESPLFQPMTQFDPLPCTNEIKWECVIKAHTLSLGSAMLKCKTSYGTDLASAISYEDEADVPLNNFFGVLLTFLIGGLFGGKSSYKISIKATALVSEDGSGILSGSAESEYANPSYFSINF